MARKTDFFGQAKAIAAGATQTLTWTTTELPSDGVIAYHVAMSGDGVGSNDLSDVSRIRVSANGANIINETPTQLRSYLESYSNGNITLDANETRFTIPLLMLDAMLPDYQDLCQFPMSSPVQLELTIAGAGAVAGNALVSFTLSNITPQCFPRRLAQVMNIGAGVQNQRFQFQENGVVRGIHVPRTGINRIRMVIDGDDVTHEPGPDFNDQANLFGDLSRESQRIYGDGEFITTSGYTRISKGSPAPTQRSYIELATDLANWAGATNEAVIYAVAPQVGAAVAGS